MTSGDVLFFVESDEKKKKMDLLRERIRGAYGK